MVIQEFIESGNYINEFKKEKVIYRKYPDKKLMIVKRKYGLEYSVDKPWLNYCRGLIIDYEHNKLIFVENKKNRTRHTNSYRKIIMKSAKKKKKKAKKPRRQRI